MDHATCSPALTATHFATSLLPLTARLIPLITEIGRLIIHFRRADLTPQAGHRFETRLQELLRETGRIIVELGPLREKIEQFGSDEHRPADLERYRQDIAAWAKTVGWL